MILKASERGGGRQLADHLMNIKDNDHVEVLDVRGFASDNLHGAFDEAYYISKSTKAQNFLFSLSMNPPLDADVSIDEFRAVAERVGKKVGLDGQPFVLVVHEKEGRRHAHAAWSKIDAERMRAINLPYWKDRLNGLSKELYLEHGWELPDGHRENGWANPLNFTLAEWQQAKRLGLDPREVKQVFRDTWQQSDNAASFKSALEERGYFLARGDRRAFVALDVHGEVHSLSRMTGVKTRDLEQRLGSPAQYRSVEEVRLDTRTRVSRKVREFLGEMRDELRERQRPLLEEHRAMIREQREEREKLLREQEKRRERENRARQSRLRTGIRGALDFIIGRAAAIRRLNEREALECVLRDRDQREGVYLAQLYERRALQERIDEQRREQRQILMQAGRAIGRSFSAPVREARPAPVRAPSRDRSRGSDDDFGL